MKWAHFPANHGNGTAEVWGLFEDDQRPRRSWQAGLLFLIRYRKNAWVVKREERDGRIKTYGELPSDTPEEELKALAIAMWRLG